MWSFILIAFLANGYEMKPQFLVKYETAEQCIEAAMEINANEESRLNAACLPAVLGEGEVARGSSSEKDLGREPQETDG